jgi:hypothetical protein
VTLDLALVDGTRRRVRAPGQHGGHPHAPGRAWLPLEEHGQDFSQQQPGTSATWARVAVPAPPGKTNPVGYLRLGAVPDSTTDTVEAPYRASAWNVASYTGAFLYTDNNRTLASLGNTFEYSGATRTASVGAGTSTTFRAVTGYEPSQVTDLPNITASTVGPSATFTTPTIAGAGVVNSVTVNGARKLTVNDLLVEEIAGDHVSYIHGNRYEFVAGSGDDTESKTTHTGAVSTTYNDSATSIYNNTYTADYYGNGQRVEAHAAMEMRINYLGTIAVRLGFVFDSVVGGWLSCSYGIYLRFLSTRFSYFDTKIDVVATLKVDCGGIKLDGYMTSFKLPYAVGVKKEDFHMGKVVLAVTTGTIFSFASSIVVNAFGLELKK